ncbi:MAG: carbonic anhydrase family protein [Burkholderiaceae bacterium]
MSANTRVAIRLENNCRWHWRVLAAAAALWCLPTPVSSRDVSFIEDPKVMEKLRDQLVETLKKNGSVKDVRAGGSEVRVSGGRLNWDGKKAGKPPKPTDPLMPLLTEATARDEQRRELLARTPPDAVPWAYAGQRGETLWSQLHPSFELCTLGNRQSPISIDYAIHVNLPAFEAAYAPAPFETVDDGRGLSAQLAGSQKITHRGISFTLKKIEFHRPAEHAVNGQRADMSAHLVHETSDGQILILAIPMNVSHAPNAALQRVIDAFPLEPGHSMPANAPINPAELLPEDQRYYEYMGSLTRPPCTENVRWLMLRQPISIAAGQHEIFESLFAPNARSLQAHNTRRIKMSP